MIELVEFIYPLIVYGFIITWTLRFIIWVVKGGGIDNL